MDDKNRSGSSNRDQDGMSGSAGRSGSRRDEQSDGAGIRDDASPGEGSAGNRDGSQDGRRAPSGSDELDGDVRRTGQSGAGGNAGSMGSGAGGMGGYGGSGTGGSSGNVGPQGSPNQ